MAWYVWVTIGLVILNWFTFTYPASAEKVVGPIWDKVNDMIGDIKFFNKTPANETNNPCPSTYEPVCGENGQTYTNICIATLDNMLVVTPGVCENG